MKSAGSVLVVCLGLSGLWAADGGKIQVSATERLDFPPGGVLHVTGHAGELTIEGWDRSDAQIVTTKSTYDSPQQQQAAKALDTVRVHAEVRGGELVVTTTLPKRHNLPWRSPWKDAAPIDVECRIQVPRGARLVVDRGEGEVHVAGLTNDIQVSTSQGDITLQLPADGRYAIDAQTRLGDVVSEFPGTNHRRRWVFAHRYVQAAAPDTHKLTLRAGWGDILITKPWTPAAAPAAQ